MEDKIQKKEIVLKTEDEVSTLTLKDHENISLILTSEDGNSLEQFFYDLLMLLLKEKFMLKLVHEDKSPGLVKEVSEKYIERLNKEIDNILNSDEYKLFAEA